MTALLESAFVDSLNGVGELKFSDLEDPLVWDGIANTVTNPARAIITDLPVMDFIGAHARVRDWDNNIARTAPLADPAFSAYEFEFERSQLGAIVARIKVVPSTTAIVYEFDAGGVLMDLPNAIPETTFSWDAWIKLNELVTRMISEWAFSQL